MRIDEELNTARGLSEGLGLEDPTIALPAARLETVKSWGGASEALGYVYRPATVEDLGKVFNVAAASGRTVGLRGSGNSYGDATLNSEQIMLDLRRMNRVLDWDPQAGRIQVQPGVTIRQFWEHVIEDGWWPAVVPGTAKPTLGGCAGMNVHGKNAWKTGTVGDHIYEFELMLSTGEIVTCNREQNSDLFYAAIGGFGMLGAFTSLTLSLKRVYSGLLEVEALASRNLKEMMEQFEEYLPQADYLVGWIDAFAGGRSLGRGQIHVARYLPPGADPYPQQTLRLENQHLSDTMFGFVPRSIMWRFMRPFMNNLGARLVNFGKYRASRFTHGSRFVQSHVAFHFLLDYVPNWKRSYGRSGLIQYQRFIPVETAHDAFGEMLGLCQHRGLPNYLTVLKRHRPDDFLISHGVDGYSLAMDFQVTSRNRRRLMALTAELDEIVLNAGGRFYFAKDSTLRPTTVRRYLGDETVERFAALKSRYDPDGLLNTNMWQRLFRS
ncbi:MAG: FAD-binding oxidoreductase [Chloroflexota bacterium]|nr:MAG: FAD-binding oxidoreductase [Chloroflexota bacterium]